MAVEYNTIHYNMMAEEEEEDGTEQYRIVRRYVADDQSTVSDSSEDFGERNVLLVHGGDHICIIGDRKE